MTLERRIVAASCLALAGGALGDAIATIACRALGVATLAPAAAGTLAGIVLACVLGTRALARRLPGELDGWFARRRRLRWLWALGIVLAVANTARLGIDVADPTQVWASMFPPVPESAHHQCFAAYMRAGELAAAGQRDLWRPDDYAVGATTTVHGLGEYLSDPYQYPPQFTLLPRAALGVTNDYLLVRAGWFGLSVAGFVAALLVLGIAIGGRAGATSLLLAPLIVLSFPTTQNFQFGQAHLLVVAASIAAMVLFAKARDAWGGLLLAFAITAKIFPGLLLLHLAVRRQWRAIAYTLAAIGALTALAALVLGPGTLAAFVTDQLPRMSSGSAFGFAEHNPDNHSLYGLAFKLADLGVPGAGPTLARVLAWLWTALAIALTWIGSRDRGEPARDALLWLGILCLATLRTPFAPSYTAVGTLWLLAVLAGVVRPSRRAFAAIAVAWVLLEGFPPVFGPSINAALSLPSQLVSIGFAVWSIFVAKRARSEVASAP